MHGFTLNRTKMVNLTQYPSNNGNLSYKVGFLLSPEILAFSRVYQEMEVAVIEQGA